MDAFGALHISYMRSFLTKGLFRICALLEDASAASALHSQEK